jgi:hypothetical protein
MTARPGEAERQVQRIAFWGDDYLRFTKESKRRAAKFHSQGDHFTAYMYLFVAFNNLYCLLAGFKGQEADKITCAVRRIPGARIRLFYTAEYVDLIRSLNDGAPEQLVREPDNGERGEGIVNMGRYFAGQPVSRCLAHIDEVAEPAASIGECTSTLAELASTLLFTIRNNQFHAIKGVTNLADQFTLERAFGLLLPIVNALLPIATNEITGIRQQV